MKKEDASGLIVFALLIAAALVFGLTVLRTYAMQSGLETYQFVLLILGALLAGLVFNAILCEVAHIIGAKAGRYDIISVNIFYFCFYRELGKWKFKFSGFDGLTGETKIFPKENAKKEPNPKPYLLFGTLFLGIVILAFITLFTILNGMYNPTDPLVRLGYFLLIMAVISIMILFYNILPIHLDSITDGYRLRTLSNPKNKEAFNELLRVEYLVAEGKTDVEIKTFTTITEYTASLNLNKVYLLLDKKEYKEAETILDIILAGKESLSNRTYIRTRAQKIYINLINKSIEEAQTYYDENVPVDERREISNDVSMASIRTYLLMSGLLDKSRSECIIALNNVAKAYRATPKMRKHVELVLFNEALEKVHNVHPKWELMDYKLEEKK